MDSNVLGANPGAQVFWEPNASIPFFVFLLLKNIIRKWKPITELGVRLPHR
jgi:hypothetical protein